MLRALLTLSSVLAAKFSCSRMMNRGNPPMVVKRMILSDQAAPAGAMRKPMPERALIAALAIIAVSAAWFATAPTAAAAEAEKFGDWILRCEARGEGQGELCYLHQTINYSKDDVSGMLLDVKIGAFSENEDLYALIMLPLGLNFPSGVMLQADAGESTQLTVQTCTKEGCRSVAKISDELLWGFRRGNLLKVGFVAFGGTQTAVVEASLTGFTAAFKAMQTR